MPVLRCDVMSQRVFIIVRCYLWIGSRTRGKEHQHRIVSTRRLFWSGKIRRKVANIFIKTMPGFSGSTHHNFRLQSGISPRCLIYLPGNISICGTDHGVHFPHLKTIFKIFFSEKIGGRDRHRPDLVQGKQRKPKLKVAFEHKHNLIALLNPQIAKIIRRLVRILGHIAKRKMTFASFSRYMKHCKFIGTFFRHDIHYIIGKVKIFIIHIGD